MADLQELFSRLKAQPSNSQSPPPATQQQQQTQYQQPPITIAQRPQSQNFWAGQSQPIYQQPSVSSPITSPPVYTPNPVHPSAIISPVGPSMASSPPPQSSLQANLEQQQQERTNNLLNLLKFSPNTNTSNQSTGSALKTRESTDTSSTLPPEKQEGPPANTQQFLLSLLTNPNPAPASGQFAIRPPYMPGAFLSDPSSDQPRKTVSDSPESKTPNRETSPGHQFGATDPPSSVFNLSTPQPTKAAKFNYVNPFDQLQSSSPLNLTPKPEAQEQAQAQGPKKIEILKHDQNVPPGTNGGTTAAAASKPLKPEPVAKESVSEALEGVGEKVDKQVEEALQRAESQSQAAVQPPKAGSDTKDAKEESSAVEPSWESAEDSEAAKEEISNVLFYNFPMRPFVSIKMLLPTPTRTFKAENLMKIAQLKKEFDQIDRSLVTSSQSHIVYAQVATKKDNGGFRVIMQDSGDHKQVFRSSGERIFNVQICSPPNASSTGGDTETVLGTGVDGSVFWTSLAKSSSRDNFIDDDIEGQGFIMPAITTTEENTSGSPVKTRARVSNRHTEYFALARGKTIYLVSPDTAKDKAYFDTKTKKVNSEKYFAEHSLKISTGKAGKDFCFSEDDSTIVSLDKGGRIKFWDIRELTTSAVYYTSGPHAPIELKTPIWSLVTGAAGSKHDEKPSVSSIMFVDKDRPTAKGVALRYLIVGFKQNHILQLWDLGLGKAVQEIRLPHEKDSDGICSLSYSPKTSIITIGHPTRNSLYFIQLSSPKYSMPAMDQASYITKLARNDPTLPRVDSTAIMSGVREFSFGKAGSLRSVDMLKSPVPNEEDNVGEETLFELYTMHSKGVVGIHIKRSDLGWDEKMNILESVDAAKEGFIEINSLAEPNGAGGVISETAKPKKADPQPAKDTPVKKEERKKDPPKGSVANQAQTTANIAIEKQSTKQIPEASKTHERVPSNPPLMTPDSYAMAAQRMPSSTPSKSASDSAPVKKTELAQPDPSTSAPVGRDSSSEDFSALLGKEFNSLYQRIESDKRVQEAAGAAKQDAMLRLVSSTLTDNVEKSLARIVSETIAADVVPAIAKTAGASIDKKLAETLPLQITASVQGQIKSVLPQAIAQAFKEHDIIRAVADQITVKTLGSVENVLKRHVPELVTQAAHKTVSDVEVRTQNVLQLAEQSRKHDLERMAQLTHEVRALANAVNRIAEGQLAFQQQMRDWQSVKGDASSVEPQKPAGDDEVKRITELLVKNKFEEATISWLQSSNQAELFDNLFIRVNPEYLRQVSPLVSLSVGAAVTASFANNVDERLNWLIAINKSIDLSNSDVVDVAPKIMDVLIQRLQGAYMAIAEERQGDPILQKVVTVWREITDVRAKII